MSAEDVNRWSMTEHGIHALGALYLERIRSQLQDAEVYMRLGLDADRKRASDTRNTLRVEYVRARLVLSSQRRHYGINHQA